MRGDGMKTSNEVAQIDKVTEKEREKKHLSSQFCMRTASDKPSNRTKIRINFVGHAFNL